MPMPACLAAARFHALARLADLVSRAYIQCMAEIAEDPRRSAERRRALELLAASPDGCTAAILLRLRTQRMGEATPPACRSNLSILRVSASRSCAKSPLV